MSRKTRTVGKDPLHRTGRAKAALALRALLPEPSPEQRQSDAHDKIIAGWVHSQWVAYATTTYKTSVATASHDFTVAQEAMVDDVNRIWPTALEWHIRHRLDLVQRIRSAANPDRRLELAAVQDLAHLSALYSQDKAALARAGLDKKLGDTASQDPLLLALLAQVAGPQIASSEKKENEE